MAELSFLQNYKKGRKNETTISDSVCWAQLLLHLSFGSLAQVGGLDKFMHANQGLLEGVEGGGEHLLLDLGAVRAPGHQEELLLLARLGGSLALVLVLVVIQSVPALSIATLLQVVQVVVVG